MIKLIPEEPKIRRIECVDHVSVFGLQSVAINLFTFIWL